MLLKFNHPSLETMARVPHRLLHKVGNMWAVEHPEEGCECMVIHSLRYAPWVGYNQIQGVAACDHCKVEEFMPCPAVRTEQEGWVMMDVGGIAGDLKRFGDQHQNCAKPVHETAEKSD